MLVQCRRDRRAALRLMRKLLRKQGFTPKSLTTDKLGSYGAAFRHLGLTCPHEQGLWANNSRSCAAAGILGRLVGYRGGHRTVIHLRRSEPECGG